jgi:DNA (cytosine-5)-methyltransferase 1
VIVTSKKFRTATLFSGAGGLDTGFVQTGNFKMMLANDVLSSPAESYCANYSHKILDVLDFNSKVKEPVYIVGDISKIDFRPLGSVDCMVGGPPCQDFSVARGTSAERKGVHVERGKLYSHFIRALIATNPKVFAFENVPGLMSANGGATFGFIIEDFSKLNLRWDEVKKITGNKISEAGHNYSIIFSKIVDSSKIGVPQKRNRLIIIGVRSDLIDWVTETELRQRTENILLGRQSILSRYPLTAMEAFTGLALPDLQEKYIEVIKQYKPIVEDAVTDQAKSWRDKIWKNLTFDVVKDYLFINNIKLDQRNILEIEEAFEEHVSVLKELGYYHKNLEGRNFEDGSNNLLGESEAVAERMRMIPPDENSTFVDGTKWQVKSRGMSHIYRRLHPLKPAYTVLAYGGGGTWSYHYERERGKLTNRERARLQTFPDEFRFKGNVSEIRAQIGEAVPTLLGNKIAKTVEIILNSVNERNDVP